MPPQQQAADGAAEEGTRQQSWEDRLWSIGKSMAIFIAIQFAMRQFMGGGSSKPAVVPEKVTPAEGAAQQGEAFDYSVVPQSVYPMWPANTSLDVNMYISDSVVMPPFQAMSAGSLIIEERGFALEKSKKDFREIHTSFSVPKAVQNNGTLWAHIFVAQSGAELDPSKPGYDTANAYRMLRPVTSYLSKKKVVKTRNLLGAAQNETELGEDPEEEQPSSGPSIASYYHPNFTLSFIPDSGVVGYPNMHPALRQFYVLDPTGARDESGKNGFYYPLCYLNTFWQLKSHMTELNSTLPVDRLDMNVALSTLANWQFSIMATMDEGMKETARKAARGESTPGGGDGSEMELIKETLLDTNPFLLGTTVIATLLHMVFEMLAFKSDVGHWRKKKDNVGVSVRTILSNVVMQSIILLYLLDNNESTSYMILFGQGVGIAIEAWKITKTVNVRVREPAQDSFFYGKLPYTVIFEDKHELSETEEKTEEYDRIAFKWMGIVAVPLLLAYAVYSLIYDTHKSWYSFIITTLVGSVYAYGFLMMVPSLYINYRLKSVAHMPARTMMYKFLNTFIDDLFAFTIKMPLLHRLATLRDDVIFFFYLYQAWAYKVDYTRVNEFGQGGDDEGVEEKKASEPLKGEAGGKGLSELGDRVSKEGKQKANGAVSSGKDAGGGRKRKG
ncbi:uncharacterized protein LTR77_002669 [Saxophila tyrrhenica]|uniref:Cleft lip and palate transmembrane 1 n=1 Tax=Saxophila tyrrhenica TaxID=1690608 RepID=A0AAV9PI24_9PEZI|nr:hypothetical protein LTR77_002669 [Saxophila tyrrhenica]